MRFSVSAAGFAAASLLCLLDVFHPTPSRAWQIDAPAAAPLPAVAAVPLAPSNTLPLFPLPAAAGQPSLKAPVTRDQAETLDAEDECLATAVYFEAKGESARGQRAVAQVIVNRTRSGRFPASLCGVVRQRGQFSFVRRGRLPAAPRGCAAWRKAVDIMYLTKQPLSRRREGQEQDHDEPYRPPLHERGQSPRAP
jgi:N-acetylmuramoyl-L-alanine amidase